MWLKRKVVTDSEVQEMLINLLFNFELGSIFYLDVLY